MPLPSFDPAPPSQFLTLLRFRPLGHTASHVFSTLFKFSIHNKKMYSSNSGSPMDLEKTELYPICNMITFIHSILATLPDLRISILPW